MNKLKETVLYMLIGLFLSCVFWIALYVIFKTYIEIFGSTDKDIVWLLLSFIACLAIFILRQLNKIIYKWYNKSSGFYLKSTISIVLSHTLIYVLYNAYEENDLGVAIAGMYVTLSILIAIAIGIVIGIFRKLNKIWRKDK